MFAGLYTYYAIRFNIPSRRLIMRFGVDDGEGRVVGTLETSCGTESSTDAAEEVRELVGLRLRERHPAE